MSAGGLPCDFDVDLGEELVDLGEELEHPRFFRRDETGGEGADPLEVVVLIEELEGVGEGQFQRERSSGGNSLLFNSRLDRKSISRSPKSEFRSSFKQQKGLL